MGFVTDFIWRSPLGLRINAQATAEVLMTEEWVKLGANQLAPKDGEYDVRITAELWETHFFDHVSMMVVDHPENTEVFVDERFPPSGPLELRLFQVGRPVAPRSAARAPGCCITSGTAGIVTAPRSFQTTRDPRHGPRWR